MVFVADFVNFFQFVHAFSLFNNFFALKSLYVRYCYKIKRVENRLIGIQLKTTWKNNSSEHAKWNIAAEGAKIKQKKN